MDCILDPVGGNHMLECLRCTKQGACILTVGYASGVIPQVPVEKLIQQNIALIGVWTTPSHYPAEVQ